MPASADPQVACIILAAGQSSRFGSPKMLSPLGDGQPLILTTINCYLGAFDQAHVVLREDDEKLAALLKPLPVQIVRAADSARGMSQSLIAGISATPQADAWLIALGDMPYLQTATLHRLRAALDQHNIVVPYYQGRAGNPVGFGRAFKNDLLALQGDKGGKSVIHDAGDKVVSIETGDEGVLLDIDYPAAVL